MDWADEMEDEELAEYVPKPAESKTCVSTPVSMSPRGGKGKGRKNDRSQGANQGRKQGKGIGVDWSSVFMCAKCKIEVRGQLPRQVSKETFCLPLCQSGSS